MFLPWDELYNRQHRTCINILWLTYFDRENDITKLGREKEKVPSFVYMYGIIMGRLLPLMLTTRISPTWPSISVGAFGVYVFFLIIDGGLDE